MLDVHPTDFNIYNTKTFWPIFTGITQHTRTRSRKSFREEIGISNGFSCCFCNIDTLTHIIPQAVNKVKNLQHNPWVYKVKPGMV